MIGKLSALFTVVTVLELLILIPLGQALGLLPTAVLVVGTAVLGAVLTKRQGIAIWKRIQKELRSGELPQDSLLDGVAVLIAGAFLMTPGVLTDVAGLALLIPFLRAPFRGIAKRKLKGLMESSSVTYISHDSGSFGRDADPFSGFGSGYDAAYDNQGGRRGPDEDVIDVGRAETEEDTETQRESTADSMLPGVE